jgi:hypothetical protein
MAVVDPFRKANMAAKRSFPRECRQAAGEHCE